MLYTVDRIIEDNQGRKWAVICKGDICFEVPVKSDLVQVIRITEVDDE